MQVATLRHPTDFDGWRAAARAFRQAGVRPESAAFRIGGEPVGLFDEAAPAGRNDDAFTTPGAFIALAREVILHRAADRFDLLYRLVWRLRQEPDLMRIVTDPDVADALERAKNVSRASHKMKAFVRFRRVEDTDGEAWVAWFEPAHFVVEKTAPFFVRRFTTLRWSILTPDGSGYWDGEALTFGPAATRDMAPAEDEIEDFWKTYYAATFNPARLKTRTMQGEMPRRYWKNLPEAQLIPDLIARSGARTEVMVARPATAPNARLAKTLSRMNRDQPFGDGFAPANLAELGHAVQACRRCPIGCDATQGVCGEGPRDARLMIVGEQPGDQEDLTGRPFIGPAGELLDAALAEAGIVRGDAYVTNAVKHFKHTPRGKRRLHQTPVTSEISACRWWLDAERRLIQPKVILALGATAALSVLGRRVAVSEARGRAITLPDGAKVVVTVHPAYLLRIPDRTGRAAERERFLDDLRRTGQQL
ncbi:UdgX family uracil-DNA binding protein [uncultured Brevundimonas sp.]|uniref:UdgX family uracil-DNA binding protein n=1 Tax=uncultured Brevundimonas sp. TaxID=213418 RepID=UPI0030EC521E|tara:strand:- start:3707 stop:5137 length:1431 start_codon:yes stop_codon:yes gene_type:complete